MPPETLRRSSHLLGSYARSCLDTIWQLFPRAKSILDDENRNVSFNEHRQLFEHHRAHTIISRVRQLALLFLALSVFAIYVNFLIFPEAKAIFLSDGLLFSSLAYVVLIAQSQKKPSIGHARIALVMFFTISSIAFLYCNHILKRTTNEGIEANAELVYTFLPLVLLASESLFPMNAGEALFLCDLPVLSLVLIAHFAYVAPVIPGFNDGPLLILLLLLFLIVGAGSYSQFSLMERLLCQSLRDPLTQALTRRSGELAIQLQLAQAKRLHSPFAVAFLDLDNFKQFNDRGGHESGDAVLRCVADFLRTRLRESDTLIRWAGDEFLILMPNATAEDAVARLDSLSNSPCHSIRSSEPVTWSCGATQWSVRSRNQSWQDLIAAADARMYRAKRMKTGNVREFPQIHKTNFGHD